MPEKSSLVDEPEEVKENEELEKENEDEAEEEEEEENKLTPEEVAQVI